MKRQALPNRIREWRERRDLTQDALADATGTSKMQISRLERGERRLTQGWMERIAEVLGCRPADLLPGAPESAGEAPPDETAAYDLETRPSEVRPSEVRLAEGHLPLAAGMLRRDVPVLGTSRGGVPDKAGDFEMNGEVVDHVRRPPGIAGLRDVFALYVVGESMAPWREPGDLVYVTRARQPRPGDYIVAELLPQRDGDPPSALLKRFVAVRGERLVLEQYNPRQELRLDQRRVRHLFRVIDWPELLGV